MRLWMTILLSVCTSTLALADEEKVETGTVHFKPVDDQANVPKMYQLQAHTFDYRMSLRKKMPTIDVNVYDVQFPSPIKSPHKENNIVHARYYRPNNQKQPMPGIVVLHITGGDQTLSRMFSTYFAQKKIPALFMQMAYYGPRRPPNSGIKLLSAKNIPRTLNGIRQTVLDIRRASAWLESRPEIDKKRLGLMGTSLGSIIGALASEMEPRFRRTAMLLGGGGLIDAYYDHPRAEQYRKLWETFGGSKAVLKKMVAPYDPITKAANLKGRNLLMLAGKQDQVVPPIMARAMWEASGKQKIIWYDCGHFTSVLYLMSALKEIVNHFHAP